MKTRLVGLMGAKGCGKDTVAKILRKQIGARRIAFADALKQELAVAFGATEREIDEAKEEFRALLQSWGETRRRMDGALYWIRRVEEAVDTYLKSYWVVITDVRHENEAQYVRDRGGILVRVIRPDLPQDTTPTGTHVTEQLWKRDGVAEIDLVNSGTFADLETKVREMMATMTKQAEP